MSTCFNEATAVSRGSRAILVLFFVVIQGFNEATAVSRGSRPIRRLVT